MTDVRKVRRPGTSAAGMSIKSTAVLGTDPLDPGDRIEYALTVEIKHPRKGSFWPKMGAASHVRPGETGEQALGRLVAFVTAQLDEQVLDILGT